MGTPEAGERTLSRMAMMTKSSLAFRGGKHSKWRKKLRGDPPLMISRLSFLSLTLVLPVEWKGQDFWDEEQAEA